MSESKEPDLEQCVAAYVKLRDTIASRDKAHKEAQAPYKAQLEKLENVLQDRMQKLGVESLRTGAGTAYLSKAHSVKVEDWEQALDYILNHKAYHLLERRIAKTPLMEAEEEVPGVSVQTVVKTNVRRK